MEALGDSKTNIEHHLTAQSCMRLCKHEFLLNLLAMHADSMAQSPIHGNAQTSPKLHLLFLSYEPTLSYLTLSTPSPTIPHKIFSGILPETFHESSSKVSKEIPQKTHLETSPSVSLEIFPKILSEIFRKFP